MKKTILFIVAILLGCNVNANKKKFHNSDFTRKKQNGIYKYYTRYEK
jgi:hypothetical protein